MNLPARAASFRAVPALEDYALLGDRRTAALVSRAGSVDWWCTPALRRPGVLRGAARHARARPVLDRAEADAGRRRRRRRYRPGTMVLETEHETATGRVRVVDCLALGHARPLLVRARRRPRGRRRHGGRAHRAVRLRLDRPVGRGASTIGGARSRVRTVSSCARRSGCTGAGQTSAASSPSPRASRSRSCSAGSRRTTRAAFPTTPTALVDDTTAHWARWSARCEYSGEWREPVLRSLLTLEALTFEATGGIVAAPTTSLPETHRRHAQLGLPLLLGARRDADARSVAHRRLPARGAALARVAPARRGR